jgi:hypothetical protein
LLAIGTGWWLFHPPGQAAKQAAHPPTNAPGSPAAATARATDQKSIAVNVHRHFNVLQFGRVQRGQDHLR